MKRTYTFASMIILALSACGKDPDAANSNAAADEFAARINGGDGATEPQAAETPTIAQPLTDAGPGAFSAGTYTDPQSATCDANKMGSFLGKLADNNIRNEIQQTADPRRQIRFIRPGGAFVKPDITNPRLNIMLDNQDIIRDIRCG